MRAATSRVAIAVSSPTPLQSLLARRWRPQWVCPSRRNRQLQWRGLAASSRTSPKDVEKPFYITTPIFYVNADPHVGHMYTMILTDVLKRWQELKGRKAILCTGTDEHGLKIQQAAAKVGVRPKTFCDKGAETFKNLAERINISNDVFIRTTDFQHREAVEYTWHMLNDRDYIYESKHEGWYSVSDEAFYPKGQVQTIVDPPTGRKIVVSIETGKEVEWTSERNYHFKLSAFRERLLEFYEQNPDFIVPKTRMAEVISDVSAGLEDLSISRPVERLTWGIRTPSDESQTIYVWLDALFSYASAIGYPFTPGTESAKGWPPDVQVIGKDILRFHCIYWPAFLMALELPLPKQILTHAHWTLGKKKMAKSTGNVVSPFFALERFGVDAMRWFLVHDGGITDDGDYDNRFIINRYKNQLQNGLGNLTNRILQGKGWNVRDAVQAMTGGGEKSIAGLMRDGSSVFEERDVRFYEKLDSLRETVDEQMNALMPNRALQEINSAIDRTNAYVQHTAPWALAKQYNVFMKDVGNPATLQEVPDSDGLKTRLVALKKSLDATIFLDAEALRIIGIMLQPFIPESAARLLDMLGVLPEHRSWRFGRVGADASYGTPLIDVPGGAQGSLFPKLTSYE